MDEEFVLWVLDYVTVEQLPSQNDLAGAIQFRAVYGSAVGLEQDEQSVVRQFSRNLTSTAIIPGYDVGKAWMDRHRNFHIANLQDGSAALWPRRSYDVIGKDHGLSIIPFTQNDEGNLEPDTRNRGVITFFRYPQDDHPQWLPTLASDGPVFPLVPLNGSSLYLPESGAILALNADYISLKLLPAGGQ